METENIGPTSTSRNPQSDSTVMEDAQSLLQELRGLGHDHFRLAALETQQAGLSLVAMLIAGMLIALFFTGAWLGFLAFGVLVLMEQGVMASSAILLTVVGNLLLVLVFLGVIRRKSRDLTFPGLLRSLQPIDSNQGKNRKKS